MTSTDGLPPLTIPDDSVRDPGPITSKSSINPASSPQNVSLNSNDAPTPRTIYANRKAEREATSLQMMMHMNAKKVKSIQSQVSVCAGSLLARGLDEGGACYMRLYMYACMY